MFATVLLLLGSLAALVTGAAMLVRGAAGIGERLGLSSLFIGLTLVGCGTSMPELAASLAASARGEPTLAVGNVLGSNVFNVAFILGLTAFLCPIHVQFAAIRREVWVVVATAVLPFAALLSGGRLERWFGALLLGGLVLYLGFAYRAGRREQGEDARRVAEELKSELGLPRTGGPSALALGLLVAFGVVALVLGSIGMVHSASLLARHLSVSELAIGLTVVAAGTSSPELFTSVVAALRKQPDIAVGNVLGSNIFNVLGILGLTSLIEPQEVAARALRLDVPVMLAASLALVPIAWSGARISRVEGGLLLLGYVVYVAVQFAWA